MSVPEAMTIPTETLQELITLLWGNNIQDDVFKRWNQGFTFSEDEPSALLQQDGGPCSVIVPVQAFLLKNLLFSAQSTDNWRQPLVERRNKMLCEALTDIVVLAQSSTIATLVFCAAQQVNCQPPSSSADTHAQGQSSDTDQDPGVETIPSATGVVPVGKLPQPDEAGSSPKRQRLSHEEFHSSLRMRNYTGRSELCEAICSFLPMYQGDCGVLLLLYSIFLTKDIERVKSEVGDVGAALIDSTHGHGSQSMINLLLTGKAASHVWDNEKDISGLKLQGIASKSQIGYLTLLEHMRYLEVGWYLKNPTYPIWLLGSETHLTILFSLDRTLVGEETSVEKARRLFGEFDVEARGFINVDSLGELMKQLDLVSVPEYVKIMAEKLDPEQLGVITLNVFLEEFFACGRSNCENSQTFTVYHYNGLPQSCINNKVMYTKATCLIMDMPEVQLISDYSPIKHVLLTKWPTIELNWLNNIIPSLN